MKNITREEFERLVFELTGRNVLNASAEMFWSRIQEAQSSEPMSVDQIEPVLRKVFQDKFGSSQPTTEWMDFLYKMAKDVAPLTVQQGFIPDWSKAQYDGVKGVTWCFVYETEEEISGDMAHGYESYDGYIPRPTPKTRERTRDDKIAKLVELGYVINARMLNGAKDSTIDDLCTASGISLTCEVK